jgi:hypothetical protein
MICSAQGERPQRRKCNEDESCKILYCKSRKNKLKRVPGRAPNYKKIHPNFDTSLLLDLNMLLLLFFNAASPNKYMLQYRLDCVPQLVEKRPRPQKTCDVVK